MNICFLCRNILRDKGGIETYTHEMANALGRKGTLFISSQKIRGICTGKGWGDVGDGEDGITVPPVNPQALAQGVVKKINRFHIERAVDATIAVYEKAKADFSENKRERQ